MPSEMFFPFLSHITDYSGLNLNQYGVASPRCLALPYYLYCLRLRRLVLI
ncbi:hypothetical protein [Neisseria meningitidis]|nr:hypothetical protein [Neisseria meningitidis]